MDYPVLENEVIENLIPLGDRILVEWDESHPYLLGGRLVRPETERGKHYCGTVVRKGIDVYDDEIKEGKRVFWEQFGGFDKYQSEDGTKRYAFIRYGYTHATIPKRMKVTADDWKNYGIGEDNE